AAVHRRSATPRRSGGARAGPAARAARSAARHHRRLRAAGCAPASPPDALSLRALRANGPTLVRMATRSDNLPRRFARIYAAAITDVLDEMGLERQTLPSTIQPLAPDMRAAGYAFTARGRARKSGPRERDATLRQFLKMLGAVPTDSVLVLGANDNGAAHFGELSVEWFRARRVRGAVIDGGTRDAASITRLRFPTFVRYRTPQDSVPRWHVSDWGQPLTIGGVRIALGDVIVADLDGVVVVPRRAAHEVLVRCEKLVGTETRGRTGVRPAMTPLAAYEKFGRF